MKHINQDTMPGMVCFDCSDENSWAAPEALGDVLMVDGVIGQVLRGS